MTYSKRTIPNVHSKVSACVVTGSDPSPYLTSNVFTQRRGFLTRVVRKPGAIASPSVMPHYTIALKCDPSPHAAPYDMWIISPTSTAFDP